MSLLLLAAALVTLVGRARSESFSPDNERLGIAYEFKIHLDAGKEDCFYQLIQPHSSLYVAFQVSGWLEALLRAS